MSVSHCIHIIRNKNFFFFLNEKNFGPIVAIAKSGEKSRDNFWCTTVHLDLLEIGLRRRYT